MREKYLVGCFHWRGGESGGGEEGKVEKRKYMKMRSRFLGRKERKAPVEVAV